jgi:hypothetical protein
LAQVSPNKEWKEIRVDSIFSDGSDLDACWEFTFLSENLFCLRLYIE